MDVLQRSPISNAIRPSLDDDSDLSWMAQDGKHQPAPNVTNITADYGSPPSPIWQAGRSEPVAPPAPVWQAQDRGTEIGASSVIPMQTPAWVSPAFDDLAAKIARAIVDAASGVKPERKTITPGVRTFRGMNS